MPVFYTLCPKNPQCRCADPSQCSDPNPRFVTRSLKGFTASLLPIMALGATLGAIAITLTPTCAHAGQCGTCHVSGKAGSMETIGLHQYCIPCEVTKPDQTIAFVDIPPEAGGHRKLMAVAAFDPGTAIGAPRKTGVGAGRNS